MHVAAVSSPIVRISVFNHAKDNVVKAKELELDEFVRLLSAEPELADIPDDVTEQEIKEIKESGEMWSPCTFNGPTRSKDVAAFNCFPLDFDTGTDGKKGLTGTDEDLLFEWLSARDYKYVAHTSFTSGYFAPRRKLRVVLFLDKPIKSIEQYKRFWIAFTSKLPVKPDATRNDNGCFFSPRCPREHADLYESFYDGSKLVQVSAFDSVFGDLNNVDVRERALALSEAEWAAKLRTTPDQAWALVRAASFSLAMKAAHPEKSETAFLTMTWKMCREALEQNPVPTRKWDSKYKACADSVRDGWAIGLEEWKKRPRPDEDQVKAFSPTEAQMNRAVTTLKKQSKLVATDAKQLSKAAYLMGRYTPHVLSPEHVRNELFKAATQLEDTRNPGINGAQADLEIAGGLAKGQKDPHFIYAGWRSRLTIDKEKGTIVPCDSNAGLFFQHHPDTENMLRFNVRKGKTFFQYAPPWPFRESEEFPCALRDDDGLGAEGWLATQLGKPLSSFERTIKVMGAVGRQHEYDPFKDWLEAQAWDGVPRLDSWLRSACGVEDTDYHRLVGSKYVLSIVARAMKPGCDAQHALVLCGPQGIGKSQAFRALASAEFFCSNAGELGSEEFLLNLEKYVIVELAELAGFSKKAIEEIKQIMTGTQEDIRRKYAHASEELIRRGVFGGTTNVLQFLLDETGNRRFWPVLCATKIDVKWIEENRAQLFAEALLRYKSGEPWWPNTEKERELCEDKQREHLEIDELDEKLEAFLEPLNTSLFMGCEPTSEQIDTETRTLRWATMPQIYHILGLRIQDNRDQRRVRKLLTIRGWEKKKIKINNKWFKIVTWRPA